MALHTVADLFRDEIVIYRHSDTGPLKVREEDPASIIKTLKILNVPAGSVAVMFDYKPNNTLRKKLGAAFSQFSPLIKGDHACANKKCDFVIFFEKGERAGVILGEIKSRSPNKADCKSQLRNSEIFLGYVEASLREYHSVGMEFEVKKFVIYVSDVPLKAPTNQKNRCSQGAADEVTFLAVSPSGRNNSEAQILFSDLTPATS